jgi:FG-GAP-like repeat
MIKLNIFAKVIPSILTIIMLFGFLGFGNSPLKVNAAETITPLKDLVINNCNYKESGFIYTTTKDCSNYCLYRPDIGSIYNVDCKHNSSSIETTRLALNKRYLNLTSCYSEVGKNQVTRGIVTDIPFTGTLCGPERSYNEGIYTIDLADKYYSNLYISNCTVSKSNNGNNKIPLVQFLTNQTVSFYYRSFGNFEALPCGYNDDRLVLNDFRQIPKSEENILDNELVITNCINFRSNGIVSKFKTKFLNNDSNCNKINSSYSNVGEVGFYYPIETTKLTLNKRYLNLVSCYSFEAKNQITRGNVTDTPFVGNLCDQSRSYNEGIFTVDLLDKTNRSVGLVNCLQKSTSDSYKGSSPGIIIPDYLDNIVRFSLSKVVQCSYQNPTTCNDTTRVESRASFFETNIATQTQIPNPNTPQYPNLPGLLDNWQLQPSADFNNDGSVDVLWRNKVDGTLVLWYLNGRGNFLSGTNNPVAGDSLLVGVKVDPKSGWIISTIGDIDGDSNKDLIWHNTTSGDRVIWYLNAQRQIASGDVLPYPSKEWEVVASVDTNNDKKDDLIFRHKSNGSIVVWQSSRILDNTTGQLKYNILGGSAITTLELGKTIYGAYQSQTQKGTNKYTLQVVTTATGATSELLFDGGVKVG